MGGQARRSREPEIALREGFPVESKSRRARASEPHLHFQGRLRRLRRAQPPLSIVPRGLVGRQPSGSGRDAAAAPFHVTMPAKQHRNGRCELQRTRSSSKSPLSLSASSLRAAWYDGLRTPPPGLPALAASSSPASAAACAADASCSLRAAASCHSSVLCRASSCSRCSAARRRSASSMERAEAQAASAAAARADSVESASWAEASSEASWDFARAIASPA